MLLLVLRVFANHHDSTFSLDDFALFANLFYGRFYFHVTLPFLSLFMHKAYFALQVMRPLEVSYTETSTVTLSPRRILI